MGDPNILLVVLDSVRAKNVQVYGYHRDTTPFLSDYAEMATVYEQARTPGIHSVASHASMWTNLDVEAHQVVNHEDSIRSDATVWSMLSDMGYDTGIFTTNPVVAHASNLSDPFETKVTDTLIERDPKLFSNAHSPTDVALHEGIRGNIRRSLKNNQPVRSLANCAVHAAMKRGSELLQETVTSADLVDDFLAWQEETENPWAACLNLMDAHFPYVPQREFDQWGGRRLRDIHADLSKPPANEFIQGRPWWQLEAFEHLYDGSIRELDAHVERLIDGLKKSAAHDDTLVVLTSDHGEAFGEFSRVTGRTRLVDHSWGIDEVLTHVPLIVCYPGQQHARQVPELATVKHFPEVVRGVIEGESSDEFVAADDPVLSSTRRLRPEEDDIFLGSTEDPDDYYGPWRAVYTMGSDGEVIKYATRGDDSIVLKISDAQCACKIGDDVRENMAPFDTLQVSDVKGASKAPSDAVERRLRELGYLR